MFGPTLGLLGIFLQALQCYLVFVLRGAQNEHLFVDLESILGSFGSVFGGPWCLGGGPGGVWGRSEASWAGSRAPGLRLERVLGVSRRGWEAF